MKKINLFNGYRRVIKENSEMNFMDMNSHSQNSTPPLSATSSSTESSDSSDTAEEYSEMPKLPTCFNNTYDGSGETSDDSSSSVETNEDDSYDSESSDTTSEISGDEFPEISKAKNLYELFETCQLTEEQKNSLYDKLIESLIQDRSKMTEMEGKYERRVKFIREFEYARRASELSSGKEGSMNCGAPSKLDAILASNKKAEKEKVEPVKEKHPNVALVEEYCLNQQEFPVNASSLNANTKLVIPGPEAAKYDIEMTVETSARAIRRPEVESNGEERPEETIIVHCVIPSLEFVIEEVPPVSVVVPAEENEKPTFEE